MVKALPLIFLCINLCWAVFPGKAQNDTLNPELIKANNWISLASQHFRKNPDSAIFYLQMALPVLEEYQSWESYAKASNGLVAGFMYKEDYQKVENHGIRAINTIKEKLGKDSRLYANALNNLGAYYRRKGDLSQAMAYYKEALEITKNFDKPDPLALSRLFYNMGIIYRHQGDYSTAIKYHENALLSAKKVLTETHPRLIQINFAIARVYTDQESWKKAQNAYNYCLELMKNNSLESSYRNKIHTYHQLARIYFQLKNLDSARLHIKKADFISVKFGNYRAQVGMNILGDIALQNQKYDKALEYYRKALKYRQVEWGGLGKSPEIAHSYRMLGECYEESQRLDSAKYYYYRSLDFLSKTTETTSKEILPEADKVLQPFDAITTIEAIARSWFKEYQRDGLDNQWESSIAACSLGDKVLDRLRRTHQTDLSRLQLGQEFRRIYEMGIRLNFLKYQETGNADYVSQAFQFAEKSKAMILYLALQNTGAKLKAGIPDSIWVKEQKLKVDKQFYQNKIFTEGNNRKKTDTLKLQRWKESLFLAEEDHRDLITYLEKEYPAYYQLKYDDRFVDIEQVQRKLSSESGTLIEYFWGEEELFVFNISGKTISGVAIKNVELISQKIYALRQNLENPDFSPSALSSFREQGHFLFNILLKPVLNSDTYSNLTIVPDGLLSYLPFEILLTNDSIKGETENAQRMVSQTYRNLPYLLKEKVIGYAFSASLLIQDLPAFRKESEFFASFAPSYPDSLSLSYNKQSAEQIAKLKKGKVFQGVSASESSFKRFSGDYKILHLAMHGFVNQANPMLAYLLFSQPEDSLEDGKLYAYELYDMFLPAELIVLAACETGDGQYVQGEGVMSLSRAFRYAGCPSMISSLWKADGRSTSDLMTYLYEELYEEKSKSKALQSAKITFLKEATPDLIHPYYWANHILIGDPKPISIPLNMYWYIGGILSIIIILIASYFWKRQKN